MKLHLKPICFFSFAMGFALVAHAHATFPVRVDCRGTDLPSCGTERLGTPVGGGVEEWDTTVLEDGRLSLSSGQSVAEVLIANGAQVEGGRLAANVEWGTEKPHVVRHDVIVPPGGTLTLRNGATVLFSEGTRIWIEAGGRIVAEGAVMASLASNLTEDGKIVTNGRIRIGGHDGWWWDDPHSAALATWRKPVADCISLKDAGLVEIGFENGMELGLVPRVYTAGTADVCYGELPVPVREGFVFEGWQATVGGAEIPIGEGVPVFAEVTNLVAKWSALPVRSVSFDANGGTGEMASLSVMQGKAVELPANRFGWDGCEFVGWSTNGTDEVAYGDGETIVVVSDMNLHAVWSGDLDLRFYWPGAWLDRAFISLSSDPDFPVYHASCEEEVDLRFAVANDGSFPLAEVPVSVAFVDTNNEVLASTVLTNTFAGGFLNPGNYFDPDLWLGTLDGLEPENYTMRLSVDMGNWMGGDVHPADNTVYLRFAIADTNITLPDALDRPDWSFVCTEGRESPMCEGFMTADGKDAVQFGPLPPNATNSLSTTVTGPGTLSFRWRTSCEPKFDNFWFVVDGEWVASMSGIFADWETMSHFLEEGPHEIEWRYTKDESVSIGLDCAWLDAVEWAPSEIVTVSFASSGDDELGDLLCYSGIGYGNLPEPTRAGYRFDGWWTAAVGGMQVTSTSIVTEASARTLYAHWTPGTQTVTFSVYPEGSGSCSPSNHTYTMGVPYAWLPTPTLAPGWSGVNKFGGWYTEPYGGELITTNTIVGTNATMTLYAEWVAAPDLCFVEPPYLAIGEGSTIAVTNFSLSDAVFLHVEDGNFGLWGAGEHIVRVEVRNSEEQVAAWDWMVGELAYWGELTWETNADFMVLSGIGETGSYILTVTLDSGNEIDEKDENNNSFTLPFTVTASKEQTVTFDANGGTPETQTRTYTIGGTYDSFPEVTRPGYEFDGWWYHYNLGPSHRQVEVQSGDVVTTDSTRTFTAHWKQGVQTVTFMRIYYSGLAGGDVLFTHEYTMGQPYGWLPTVQESDFPYLANKFLGWTLEEYSQETLVSTSDIVGTNATLTLYSLWAHLPDYMVHSAYLVPSLDSTNSTTSFSTADSVYLKVDFWDDEAWFFTQPPSGRVEIKVWDSTAREVGGWNWVVEPENWDVNNPTDDYWATNVNLKAVADIGAVGTYTVTIRLDPDHQWEELDDENNIRSLVFAVTQPASQTVTFNANGGTPDTQTQTYVVGGTYGPFPSVSWDGHEFAGWFTEQGGGTAVAEGDPVTEESERTLYAHWRDNPDDNTVRFTFGTDGGTQTLALAGGSSTSHSNPLAWVESGLQVALVAGSRTTTLTVTCAANSGAKRMGILTVTVDGTEYAVEVVQDGGFGIAECTVDSDSGLFQVKWVGESGKTYTIQRAQSLDGPWTAAGSVPASATGMVSLEAAMPGKWSSGFYRLVTTE